MLIGFCFSFFKYPICNKRPSKMTSTMLSLASGDSSTSLLHQLKNSQRTFRVFSLFLGIFFFFLINFKIYFFFFRQIICIRSTSHLVSSRVYLFMRVIKGKRVKTAASVFSARIPSVDSYSMYTLKPNCVEGRNMGGTDRQTSGSFVHVPTQLPMQI